MNPIGPVSLASRVVPAIIGFQYTYALKYNNLFNHLCIFCIILHTLNTNNKVYFK